MYRGRVTQGSYLTLSVRTYDADDIPAAPTACPWLSVYDSSGVLLRRVRVPIADAGGVTGYFSIPLFLGPGFSAGHYHALYSWAVGSFEGGEMDSFQVVAGGNSQGSVVSMHEYNRPHARFAVHQTDGGQLKRGRNPRL
jgi:hypothetical protein